MHGYCGKILRVNLTTRMSTAEPLCEELVRNYIGGRGFAVRFMYDEIPVGTNPLADDNKIFVFTGPLVGTATPYSSRFVIAAKSPLSGTYTRALSGGQFGPELKYAGFDGIIVEGASQTPVYLRIENGEAEICDAAHLWGKTTEDTDHWFRENFEDAKCISIGPSGEKKTVFASVMNDWGRAAGRGGIGAVLGAKKLKAIAVRGKGGITVSDKEAFLTLLSESLETIKTHPEVPGRIWAGTTGTVKATYDFGVLPVRNYSGETLKNAENLFSEIFRKNLVVHDESCMSCPLPCGKMATVKTGQYKGTVVQGPQFETIGLLGSNCGVTNLEAVAKANRICNLYGLDTIETGNVIGFAMECYERGLLTKIDTDGIDLRFGNNEAMIAAVKAMAENKGFGKLLCLGAKRMADAIGQDTYKFAMVCKGQGFASWEPRASVGMGLVFATSPTGANHSTGVTFSSEKNLGMTSNEGKPELVFEKQNHYCLIDSMILCAFSRYGLDDISRIGFLEAVTGLKFDTAAIARRIFTLERLFNVREGFNRTHDQLPPRSTETPLPAGLSKGNTVKLEDMLNHYYPLRKWSLDGVPTKICLKELGLEADIKTMDRFLPDV